MFCSPTTHNSTAEHSQAAQELLGLMERSFGTLKTIAARMLLHTSDELSASEAAFLERFVNLMSDSPRDVVLAAMTGVTQLMNETEVAAY